VVAAQNCILPYRGFSIHWAWEISVTFLDFQLPAEFDSAIGPIDNPRLDWGWLRAEDRLLGVGKFFVAAV
jgi:hypothetical protein